MNVRDNFPGTGMRIAPDEHQARMAALKQAKELEVGNTMADHEPFEADDEADISAAIHADLARELPAQMLIDDSRKLYQRQIANHRIEKARQQAIASAAMAKTRQLTVSIRLLEDALDSLLSSEV